MCVCVWFDPQDLDPTASTLFSNRAMCHMKMESVRDSPSCVCLCVYVPVVHA